MRREIKKLLKTNLIRIERGHPRIFEKSIFPAYVPEKNKIITLWSVWYFLKN
jgi:hypothetical protein